MGVSEFATVFTITAHTHFSPFVPLAADPKEHMHASNSVEVPASRARNCKDAVMVMSAFEAGGRDLYASSDLASAMVRASASREQQAEGRTRGKRREAGDAISMLLLFSVVLYEFVDNNWPCSILVIVGEVLIGDECEFDELLPRVMRNRLQRLV